MPWLKEAKIVAKKEAPVTKTHEKKNFKGINESQEVAVNLVRKNLNVQQDNLLERLKQRKLNMFKRRQTLMGANRRQNMNQTVDSDRGGRDRDRLDSPNMSRSKCSFRCLITRFGFSFADGHDAEERERERG